VSKLTTNLIVDAGHPAVRIDVLDSDYRVRAGGYGKIEQDLPTGFYTVQYKAAEAVQERDITLRPDAPLVIDEPPDLPFASAAPLEFTSTTHEYHQSHANRLSHAEALERGSGSQLFLFVRDIDPGGRTHPAKGLGLHNLTGGVIVLLDEVIEAGRNRQEARWGGRSIALDPGFYRLRLALGRGKAIEMMVPACPGWQSQVFLLRQGGDSEVAGRTVLDFPNATQLMARPVEGFNPWNYFSQQRRIDPIEAGRDLRLVELARQALAQGYRGIRASDLKDMLWGKWQDPILGILGLHLLLQQPDPDLGLAEDVVGRLRGDILHGFHHPDIDAIELEIAQRRDIPIDMPPIEAPPMLHQSWDILVKATAEKPGLIPHGSLAFQIADRLWGASAWLIWEAPPEAPAQEQKKIELEKSLSSLEPKFTIQEADEAFNESLTEETGIDISDFDSVLAAIEDLLIEWEISGGKKDSDKIIRKAKLDETEFAILVQFQRQIYASQQAFTKIMGPLSLESLIRQLGVPAEMIQEATGSLYIKLLTQYNSLKK